MFTSRLKPPIIGYRRNGCPIYAVMGGDGRASLLEHYEAQRAAEVAKMDAILERASESGNRDLVDVEKDTLKAVKTRIAELDEQIVPLREYERDAEASRNGPAHRSTLGGGNGDTPPEQRSLGAGRGGTVSDEAILEAFPTSGHFMRDLVMSNGRITRQAGLDVDDRAVTRLKAFREGLQKRVSANQLTADTPGLLPRPLVGPVINLIDASRPFITSIGARPLTNKPGKIFDRPKITQHVTVGEQATEKTQVSTQKMVIGSLAFTKQTFAGSVDVSRQDLDWSDPEAWNILLTDLADVYATSTEDAVGDAFAAAVTATAIEVAGTAPVTAILPWLQALYSAAELGYGSGKRLPDTIWLSLNMWSKVGPIFDAVALAAGASLGQGVADFVGSMGRLPKIVVPSFPTNTMVTGPKAHYEFYEERIGVLSAVEPGILGVEVAYGGYIAHGILNADSFRKIVDAA